MSDFVEFNAEDGSTMNVEHKPSRGTVEFWLDGPTYKDKDNRDTSNELTFEIDKEQAIEIILLLEAAFS